MRLWLVGQLLYDYNTLKVLDNSQPGKTKYLYFSEPVVCTKTATVIKGVLLFLSSSIGLWLFTVSALHALQTHSSITISHIVLLKYSIHLFSIHFGQQYEAKLITQSTGCNFFSWMSSAPFLERTNKNFLESISRTSNFF